MSHNCLTGWHAVPQALCREKHGCRCDGCTEAYRAHWRSKAQRLYGYGDRDLADAERTRVQLRILRDQGWTVADLAREVGCTRQTIRWTLREDRRVSARIRSAVERLWLDGRVSA